MKPRALLYARVSTADKGQDYTAQLDELRRVADQRGWQIVGCYWDITSGAKSVRPGLLKSMALCRAGQVDIFAAVATDRFARSVLNLLQLVAELEACGVKLAATREGALDTTTPQGRAFLQTRAVFAELERSLTAERVREGLAVRKARGERLGRPPAIDYDLMPMAVELRKLDATWPQVAEILGGKPQTWLNAARKARAA